MAQRRSFSLPLPRQTLDGPSFCDGTLEGVVAWAATLPKDESGSRVRALHDALDELNRSPLEKSLRFAMLEHLRPHLHAACGAVAGRNTAAPLLRDARTRAVAELAQQAQYQAARGYEIVVATALREGSPLAPDPTAAKPMRQIGVAEIGVAIHRAATELLHTLLRSLQCYAHPPAKLWAQLNTLYAIAETRGVQRQPVDDDEQRLRPTSTLAEIYARAILLATAQPNQLRLPEIVALFRALEGWAPLVDVVPIDAAERPVIAIDLEADRPPFAVALARGRGTERLRTLDDGPLMRRLREDAEQDLAPLAPDPLQGDPARRELVRHCTRVWGAAPDRAHARSPSDAEVDVCSGLAKIHFHVGGGRSLARQLRAERRAEDVSPLDDVAGAGADPPEARGLETGEGRSEPEGSLSRLRLTDLSSRGFGLRCDGVAPDGVLPRALLALREDDDPDWRIALVRWIANGPEQSRFGVETLAQRAMSGGVRRSSPSGGDDEIARALYLPGVAALDQVHCLITAPNTFTPGQEVIFVQGGEEIRLHLLERSASTEDHARFRVRELTEPRIQEPETLVEVDVLSTNADRRTEAGSDRPPGQDRRGPGS